MARSRVIVSSFTVLLLVLASLAAVAGRAPAAHAAPCMASLGDGCGPYTDPNIPMSTGYDTYVSNQSFANSGTTAELTANDPGSWSDVVNAVPYGYGGVQMFPDSQQLTNDWSTANQTWNGNEDTPLASLSALKINYSESMGTVDSNTSAEFAPDIWQDNYGDDVMFWADTRGRCNTGAYGSTVLGTATFDGQTWTVNRYGGPGAEVIFVLDSDPNTPDSCAQQTSGTIDVEAGLNWLIANGDETGPAVLSQVNTGFEVTSAANETFSMTSYSITATVGSQGQQAPAVTTSAASGISQTAATLNGSVNPEGADASYQFDYGTSTSYGTSVPVPAGDAGSGTSAVNESANLTGLTADTTYHYRIEATNSAGTTDGADQQFTTSATAQAPTVVTQAATGISSSGAALNGTVNPNGQSTTYQFEYGTTTGYGSVSPSTPGSAGSGTSAVPEMAALTGLSPSTTYHFRLDATNATGTTQGSDQQFTTSAAGSTVVYGTTGSAKTTNSLTLSWTQSVSGANGAVLAETALGETPGGDINCGLGITDNGTAMTKLAIVHTDNQHAGYFDVFGLANPASGTNTFVATVTSGCDGGTPQELTGGSESFTGVNQSTPFGTAATAYGSGATATVATSGSSSGNIVGGFAANGSAINSASSPSTSRFIQNEDDNTGAGNSAGATSPSTGSAVTMKWKLSSDWWGAAAIEVQHA